MPTIGAIRRVTPAWQKLSRYLTLVRWVSSDALWRFHRHVIIMLTASTLGVFLQAGSVGVALLYARAIESGNAVELLGRTLDPRADLTLLVMVGITTGSLMAAATTAMFTARNTAIALDHAYVNFAQARVLALGSHLPDFRSPVASALLHEKTFNLLYRDIRYSGRILRILGGAAHSLGTLAAAFIAIVVVNTALTALLMVLVAISAVLLVKVSTAGARHSLAHEREAPKARRARFDVSRAIGSTPDPLPVDHPTITQLWTGAFPRFLDASYGRIRSVEWGSLVTNGLTAIALTVIIIVEGYSILRGDTSFTALLLYLIALRYFLSSTVQVSRVAVSINRFYPQARRHMVFVRDAQAAMTPTVNSFVRAEITAPSLASGAVPPPIVAGDALGLVLSRPLDRYGAARVAESLRPIDADGQAAAPRVWFPRTDDAAGDASADLVAEVSEDVGKVCVVPVERLAALTERDFEAVRTALRDGLLIIAYRWPAEKLGAAGECLHLIADPERTVGWATTDWIQAHRGWLNERLGARKGAAIGQGGDDMDDDED